MNAQNQNAEQVINLVATAFQCGFALIGLALLIVLLMALSNCLAAVSRRNRQMQPGQVWLNLIPCFGLVWLILTVIRVSDSLRDEYHDRGLRGDGDYGRTMGILFYVFTLVCGPVGWVFLFIYRAKIVEYTRQLNADAARDDDGDDRPRRRRRDDEYEDDDRDDRPRRRRDEDDDR